MSTNGIRENQGTQKKESLGATPDISKLLQEMGVNADKATLKDLQESLDKNPSLLETLQKDVDAAKKNPSEKGQFELLYLKGFGQVVTLKGGRRLSFAELFAEEQKTGRDVSDDIGDRPTRKAYLKYSSNTINTALNQKLNEEGSVDTALNQKNSFINTITSTPFIKRVERASSLLDQSGRSFVEDKVKEVQAAGEQSPIIQELVKNGANQEEIQSGKYDNYIRARVIIEYETALTPKDPDKAKEFVQVVEGMRGIVGIAPTDGNIDRFLGSKVLGENREAVGSAMYKLGATGKYDRMMWDDETRTVIFRGKNGEEVRIDTISIPPRLTKSRNGLSITYEKQPDNPELEKIQGEVKSAESAFGKARTEVSDSLQGAGLYSMNLDKYPIAEVQKLFAGTDFQSLQEEIGAAKTTDKQIEVQTKIRNLRAQTEGTLTKVGLQYMEYILAEKIEMNTIGIGDADEETVSQKDWQDKLKHLESLRESDQLTNYIEARQEFETKQQKLAGIKSPGVEDFDQDATDTLDTLVSLGYDELGQDTLERIIQAVNRKERSSIGAIDPRLNTPLSREQKIALTLAIANIARNAKVDQTNPTEKDQATEKARQSWQGVDQTDRFIAYRQTQSGLWRETLQSLRKVFQPGGSLHSREQLQEALYKPEKLPETPSSSTP